ncbi:hypothetical protein MTR67_025664, partial [Solanum verrucosum]
LPLRVELGQGFTWGQQWFSSAGYVQYVGSGHDKLGIKAERSRFLGCLRSRVYRVLDIGVKRAISIIRRLRHLGTISLLSYSFHAIEFNSLSFVEELQKAFEVMHVADVELVELAAYQLWKTHLLGLLEYMALLFSSGKLFISGGKKILEQN